MNDKFEPTHRIIADWEEILVQEFDGGDYFQGSIVYPYHEVRLIRLNPRS